MVWALGFIEADWHIVWMAWDAFLRKTVECDFDFFRRLPIHLIVGGFSLATDYM
jgi:hypothetical protein